MRTVITGSDRSTLDLAELRTYGGLLRYLSMRDVLVRYKQTWMGFSWSVVRPLINILIFGCISYLIDRSGDFRSRFLMVSAGVVFWQLINGATTEVSNSLTTNSSILTKVYFPKIILPLSALLVSIIDFAIAFVVFLLLYVLLRGLPSWHIILLPIVLAGGIVFSMGLGLYAATASVRYRDVKFILPFFLQILFYASPVFLSSSFVLNLHFPEWLKTLYQLNPLVMLMNAFRFCITGQFDQLNFACMIGSCGIMLAMLLGSIRYFTKFERSFADYI